MRLVSVGRSSMGRLDGVVLSQADVCAVFVIIGQILTTKPAEMALVERDHMAEHLAANTTDPSFGNSVLPRTPYACPQGSIPLACRKSKTSLPNLAS